MVIAYFIIHMRDVSAKSEWIAHSGDIKPCPHSLGDKRPAPNSILSIFHH